MHQNIDFQGPPIHQGLFGFRLSEDFPGTGNPIYQEPEPFFNSNPDSKKILKTRDPIRHFSQSLTLKQSKGTWLVKNFLACFNRIKLKKIFPSPLFLHQSPTQIPPILSKGVIHIFLNVCMFHAPFYFKFFF
ncbi:unnamed protein product [Meloidogyne enterolobii]|uniref:Uncharacterized protein n=1 Tax=Meloidogyne enterolobii TaxID=390850 RepID=A0ACB1ANP4_MELEN